MRGAGATSLEAEQEDEKLNKAIALLQGDLTSPSQSQFDSNLCFSSDRLFTLSCEEEAGEVGGKGPSPGQEEEEEEEAHSQTYAGVLRSPARTTETDQLIKKARHDGLNGRVLIKF